MHVVSWNLIPWKTNACSQTSVKMENMEFDYNHMFNNYFSLSRWKISSIDVIN